MENTYGNIAIFAIGFDNSKDHFRQGRENAECISLFLADSKRKVIVKVLCM